MHRDCGPYSENHGYRFESRIQSLPDTELSEPYQTLNSSEPEVSRRLRMTWGERGWGLQLFQEL